MREKVFGLLYSIGYLILAAIFGYASFRCFMAQGGFNILFLVVMEDAYPLSVVFAASAFVGLFFLGGVYMLWRAGISQKLKFNVYRELFWALSPLIALSMIFFLPIGFSSQIVYILIMSITTYRLLLLYTPGWVTKDLNPYVTWSILLGVTGFMVWQGYYLQWQAYETLRLPYGDWSEYLTIAKNTADGKWFELDNGLGKHFNFLATHFSPGSLLLISLYVKLFPSVKAFFVMNSMILYSGGILVYILARVKKLSIVSSLFIAVAVLLFPSLANLNLCTFNGFHPIYLIIPILLIFFIFLERKWMIPALAVFLFSLTIKETVPVFWVGMGTVLCFLKHRKLGIGIVLFSILYYFLVMHLIIPSIAGDAEYDYAFRFAHLGTSEFEILLSPLLKPGAFWGSLARPQCIYLIIMLILPLFILASYRIIIVAGAGITLMFVCLQSSNQLQNICMQYQSEGVAVVFIATVLGAGALLSGKTGCGYFSFLGAGIRRGKVFCRRRYLCAALPALLVSALCSTFFLGEHCIIDRALIVSSIKRGHIPPIAKEFKTMIPPKQPLTATPHVAGQFVLRNPVYTDLSSHDGYILINLWEQYCKKSDIDKLRVRMLKSNKHRLVKNHIELNRHYMLFVPVKSTPHPDYSKWSNTRMIDQDAWDKIPASGQYYLDKAIQIKVCTVTELGRESWRIFVRLAKKVEYDTDFKIIYRNGNNVLRWMNVFANGLRPAFSCPPGTVFEMVLKKPRSEEGNLTIIPEFRR